MARLLEEIQDLNEMLSDKEMKTLAEEELKEK